ncbi:hypothetical protein I4U23_021978 [Adineta vaga]|uniref:Uncharacterized protein n=1 Tax=Adineta vaga TaxID=104782 RepID=B3G4M1_ADIVA|nr:unknown [Adineta vaga]UJR18850.1 hypothetical protein I4U23_021978 [Adineta vaga]
MTPTSNAQNSAVSGDDGVARDVAFQALSPFSGAFSPTEVREQLVGPILNGPPTSIWRRTTISHSNADGSFCLYACERTGEAMWVPSGEHFVADRSQRGQSTGTVMDYLFSRSGQTTGPRGYGFHHTGRTVSGENRNVHRPRNIHASMVDRSERTGSTRLIRFSPMACHQPSAAGMGTRRTIARRERRENARSSGGTTTPQPPVTPSTNSTTTTTVTNNSINETSPQLQQLNLSDEEAM